MRSLTSQCHVTGYVTDAHEKHDVTYYYTPASRSASPALDWQKVQEEANNGRRISASLTLNPSPSEHFLLTYFFVVVASYCTKHRCAKARSQIPESHLFFVWRICGTLLQRRPKLFELVQEVTKRQCKRTTTPSEEQGRHRFDGRGTWWYLSWLPSYHAILLQLLDHGLVQVRHHHQVGRIISVHQRHAGHYQDPRETRCPTIGVLRNLIQIHRYLHR